jgi:hypothetical protein
MDRRGFGYPADHHADRAAAGGLVTELTVLQAVRLKGRVCPDDLAATLGEDVTHTVEQLVESGLLIDSTTLRISPSGRARLNELLTEERAGIDSAALAVAYDDFHSVNADFKALVTDWQLNRDAAALARMDDVHGRVLPIIAAAAAQLPRLDAYRAKLHAALEKIQAGEIAWLTKPLVDSYHTVWFELHEELILASGLTREQAARSGDAQ